MQKRGGLDIVIESLVLIILAMALLSYGLYSIKKNQSKEEGLIEDMLSFADKGVVKILKDSLLSSNEKIKLSNTNIEFSNEDYIKNKIAYLAIKNNLEKDDDFNINISCEFDNIINEGNCTTLANYIKKINIRNDEIGISNIFLNLGNAQKGNYRYAIQVYNNEKTFDEQTSFYINVK